MLVDTQYSHRLESIEAQIERWLPGKDAAMDSAWQSAVFPGLENADAALVRCLTEPGRNLVCRGGKRWRPMLMVLLCEALGGGNAALPLAPLVEFSHNASLIHDDIEDCSDERRGKPAVHVLYGNDTAINSGSFLYFLAPACIDSWVSDLVAQGGLCKNDAPFAKATVFDLWAGFMRKLHLGQAMDIHWHRNAGLIPTPQMYFTMCALKTGCLARLAAELAVSTAGIFGGDTATNEASPVMMQMGVAAEKLGIGFQILDDVKNISTGIAGKNRGDDIVEGKKSLPVLLFLRRYPEKTETVFRCFKQARSAGIEAPEVEELIRTLVSSGVLAEAEQQAKTFIRQAKETFAALPPERAGEDGAASARALLAGLVDSMV